MIIQWEPVLKAVISEILETMFFALVDFEEGNSGDQSFDYASRIYLFNHTGRMEISLNLSRGFARMITANFLGINENQVEEEDVLDSLKELTNMVGGGYYVRASDTDYELGIPIVWKTADEENPRSSEKGMGIYFGCLGEPAGLSVLEFVPAEPCE